jgi:hypothetical protein
MSGVVGCPANGDISCVSQPAYWGGRMDNLSRFYPPENSTRGGGCRKRPRIRAGQVEVMKRVLGKRTSKSYASRLPITVARPT